MTTTPIPPILVHSGSEINPKIRLDLDIETADTILTILATQPRSKDHKTNKLIDNLYIAVSKAVDETTENMQGCPELWSNSELVTLTEPAVLGNTTGDFLAVLIPGQPNSLDAITTAVQLANESGANLDIANPKLVAEVKNPQWIILHKCESSEHDFHPEISPQGPITSGANLLTQVDLFYDN